jgi:hypothetical protein
LAIRKFSALHAKKAMSTSYYPHAVIKARARYRVQAVPLVLLAVLPVARHVDPDN